MRRLLAVITLSLAVLVAGGCDDGGPSSDPTETPTTSPPSTSQSPTGPPTPDVPDDAQERTKAGAVAFVRYWVEVRNAATKSGDPSGLASISGKGCDYCNQDVASIRKGRENGDRIQSKGWSFVGAPEVLGKSSISKPVIQGLVRMSKVTVTDEDGKQESFPERLEVLEFSLRYLDDGWTLGNYEWIEA